MQRGKQYINAEDRRYLRRPAVFLRGRRSKCRPRAQLQCRGRHLPSSAKKKRNNDEKTMAIMHGLRAKKKNQHTKTEIHTQRMQLDQHERQL